MFGTLDMLFIALALASAFFMGLLIPILLSCWVYHLLIIQYNKVCVSYFQLHQNYVELLTIKMMEADGNFDTDEFKPPHTQEDDDDSELL